MPWTVLPWTKPCVPGRIVHHAVDRVEAAGPEDHAAPQLAMEDGRPEQRGDRQPKTQRAVAGGVSEDAARAQQHAHHDEAGDVSEAEQAAILQPAAGDERHGEHQRQQQVVAAVARIGRGRHRRRPQQRRRDEPQHVLEGAVEQQRGREHVEEAAQCAAGCDPEVELGRALAGRAALGQALMTDEPGHEERDEVDDQQHPDDARRPHENLRHDRQQQERLDARRAAGRPGDAGAERHDERQQVDSQRDDPEQRKRHQIGGEEGRERQQQAGRDGGEREPAQARRPGRTRTDRGRRRGDRRGGRGAGVSGGPGGTGAEQADGDDQRAVPDPTLATEPDERLDQEWIRQQREHAADIAGDIKEVGIGGAPVVRRREPALDQGRGRRQQHERRSGGDGQPPEEPQRLVVRRRRPAQWRGQWQSDRDDDEQGDVHQGVAPRAEPARAEVRVKIARQERQLEERHRGDPDGAAAAEHG